MMVAILGTTISPYLFFWQASQKVEEEKAAGRRLIARKCATRRELGVRLMDVGVGTLFSNLVMYFIILTTALTLHRHGITNIETFRQAAEALIPLAGRLRILSSLQRSPPWPDPEIYDAVLKAVRERCQL